MAANVAVEGVVGIVPLLGDLFDAAWKANVRNVRLLEAWAERPHQVERSSRWFAVLLPGALLLFLAGCAALTWLLLRWLLNRGGSRASLKSLVVAIWVPYMLVSKRVRNTFRAPEAI
jgi:hypothetical protein